MKRRSIGIFSSIAIVVAACGGDAGDSGSRAAATGGIGFRLQLPNGVNVSSVDYTISGPASYEKNGSLTLGADLSFAGKIDGIPVGDGYIIMLNTHGAFPDAECDGSASFSVRAKLVTAVGIRLECPGEKSDASAARSADTQDAAGSAANASTTGSGGSPAVAKQANTTSNAGHAGTAGIAGAGGSSTGGNPATATSNSNTSTNTIGAGGKSGSVMQSVSSSDCPRIDCVSAVPSADGMSVSLHGVTLNATASDPPTLAWTASAGTLSDAASSDPVLQCPTTAGDIDVSLRLVAGACSDELQMRVTCAGAH